jgi:hypothetical protein
MLHAQLAYSVASLARQSGDMHVWVRKTQGWSEVHCMQRGDTCSAMQWMDPSNCSPELWKFQKRLLDILHTPLMKSSPCFNAISFHKSQQLLVVQVGWHERPGLEHKEGLGRLEVLGAFPVLLSSS